jgi:hypothetical protein
MAEPKDSGQSKRIATAYASLERVDITPVEATRPRLAQVDERLGSAPAPYPARAVTQDSTQQARTTQMFLSVFGSFLCPIRLCGYFRYLLVQSESADRPSQTSQPRLALSDASV